jgi:hypothetical protein
MTTILLARDKEKQLYPEGFAGNHRIHLGDGAVYPAIYFAGLVLTGLVLTGSALTGSFLPLTSAIIARTI